MEFQTVMLNGQPLLAQAAATDVGDQAARFAELLLTPTGFIAAVAALAAVGGLLATQRGSLLLGAFAVFLLSMMRTESRFADNTLVQPLESLRALSRPVALLLFMLLAARLILLPSGQRNRFLLAPAICLLGFELYYLFMLGVFVDPARAAFGAVSVCSVAIAVCLGFGRYLDADADPEALMKVFGLAGVGFILANMFQLLLGYSNAILGGRLAGVSGNAQQLAATCCVFAIIACYYFSAPRLGSVVRWASAASIGILGLFILWSGSRTGTVCMALVLITFFRARIGRLAIVLAIGSVILVIASSYFQESTITTERLLYGSDTRTKVWLGAFDEFSRAPLFGSIPQSEDDSLNLSESTYLRALALLGIVGGSMVLVLVATMAWTAFRTWIAGRRCPWLAPHADMVVSSTAFMIVVNAAEGLMMGVLTIFVVFLYVIFAMAAYVHDAERQASEAEQLPDATAIT